MKWYLVELAVHDSGGIYADLPQNPVDATGETIDVYQPNASRNELRPGVDIREAPEGILKVRKGRRLADLLNYHYRGCKVVRTSAMRALDSPGLSFPESLYRWPLYPNAVRCCARRVSGPMAARTFQRA